MRNVARRLNKVDVGPVTQVIEQDIIALLKEMIEALKKAQQASKNRQNSPPSQGQPPDPLRGGADALVSKASPGRAAPLAEGRRLGQAPADLRDKVLAVRARTGTAADKKRVWPTMTAQWPDYDKYQAGSTRNIPVVLLSPR